MSDYDDQASQDPDQVVVPEQTRDFVENYPNCVTQGRRKGRDYVPHKADYDQHHRFELFLLDEGQKKVEWKEETREPPL